MCTIHSFILASLGGHTTLGQGAWGQHTYTVGRENWKAGLKGLQRGVSWTIKAFQGEKKGTQGPHYGPAYLAISLLGPENN